MITVYGIPHSRSTRVLWMLEELELDYRFIALDAANGEHKSAQYLAINPAGKVPALQIDDFILCESGAIVTYLADRYAGGRLIPKPSTQARALHDQWSFFALTELEQPLWTMGKHRFALPAEQRVPAVLDTAVWELQQALALLSQGLGDKTYILGDNFNCADILLAHTLSWALAFKQNIAQANLLAYQQRCCQRPALTRALSQEK